MRYVTHVGKVIYCPFLDMDVPLTAVYELPRDKQSDEAKLIHWTCAVAENAKLPYYEQCEKYKYLHPCPSKRECNPEFKNVIDLRTEY